MGTEIGWKDRASKVANTALVTADKVGALALAVLCVDVDGRLSVAVAGRDLAAVDALLRKGPDGLRTYGEALRSGELEHTRVTIEP